MKKRKPLSKTQGGNWWIIRRPNGSIIPDTLSRTRNQAWERFITYSPAKGIMDNVLIKQRRRVGYTCEKVQVCSTRKSQFKDTLYISTFEDAIIGGCNVTLKHSKRMNK